MKRLSESPSATRLANSRLAYAYATIHMAAVVGVTGLAQPLPFYVVCGLVMLAWIGGSAAYRLHAFQGHQIKRKFEARAWRALFFLSVGVLPFALTAVGGSYSSGEFLILLAILAAGLFTLPKALIVPRRWVETGGRAAGI